MECDICHRSPSERLAFYCTICARNAVYETRIHIAQTLLENEAAGAAVERNIGARKPVVSHGKSSPQTKSRETSTVWTMQRAHVDQAASKEETEHVLSHVEALRKETVAMKAEIARRKAILVKRKADLRSASEALAAREAATIEPLEKGVRRMEHRWDAMHAKTLESRVFLCREAAQLYGLQQRKTKKGATGSASYFIGGIPIADLRDLDNSSPVQVSTSTSHLAHLVHLISHYLSLRLPAEITLSHRDYPLPTIFSPGSSYTLRDVPYPGSTPSHSSNNSPSASRTLDQRTPIRPRPMHLNRKLSVLAKEDPAAYGLFVEGITLLAWDIAWVCKTQGLPIGTTSWEDVCAMGKNLWQLLVADPVPSTPSTPAPVPGSVPSRDSLSRFTPPRIPPPSRLPALEAPIPPSVQLGHFSHGTAHSFLAAADGTEYMSGWRLQSPTKVMEKVKAMLLSERTGAEWEILEGNEWEEEPIVGPKGKDGDVSGEEKQAEGAGAGAGEEGKTRGTSGWTKLKSRGTT